MKDLLPPENEKNSAYNNILRFYTDSDIVLTSAEETILSRWCTVDAWLRSRKFTTDTIIEKIKELYKVSRYTAENDIYKAQALFGAARKINKQYLLLHHAEDIALQIERIKYDKSLSHLLPKLYDSYTKAIAAIPEDKAKNTMPPPVFLFNFVDGEGIRKPMSLDEARAKAKEKLLKKSQPDNYTDFEDQPHEPGKPEN